MPQIPDIRVRSFTHSLPANTRNRASYFALNGVRNKPEWPERMVESPLHLTYQLARGCVARDRVSGFYIIEDAPNMYSYYSANMDVWDARLYATAYAKFVDAAKQGSAEWGMNIVQARKSLDTFIQLALTSATVVTAFCQVHKRGLSYLRRNPSTTLRETQQKRRKLGRDLVRAREKRVRLRISNEIWLLDQVSNTLLAYRYGVAPLMSDIEATAQILSEEFKDEVTLRKAAKKPWNGRNPAWDEHWTGTESVVLKATVSCHNPNLLLANRLGIINPQTWLWDNIPWSFVVDWWLPVGSFLSNLTALVGLTLNSASVTRTRAWAGNWVPERQRAWPYDKVGDWRFEGKRKWRTTGSLPVPLTVPYGKGLGIQRGQNALALIAQKLKGPLKGATR